MSDNPKHKNQQSGHITARFPIFRFTTHVTVSHEPWAVQIYSLNFRSHSTVLKLVELFVNCRHLNSKISCNEGPWNKKKLRVIEFSEVEEVYFAVTTLDIVRCH